MKKNKQSPPKSLALATELSRVAGFFRQMVSRLETLADETTEAITAQEETVKEAEAELKALQDTLQSITAVKKNVTNIIEPAS